MAQEFVRVNISESVKSALETTTKEIGKDRVANKAEPVKDLKEHKGIVEAVLRGVATRIVLAHSYKELGTVLQETLDTIRAGGADAQKIDALKGSVLDTVKKIGEGRESEAYGKMLQDLFHLEKYDEAAELLKTLSESPDSGLTTDEKNETKIILEQIKPQDQTTIADLENLKKSSIELAESNHEKKSELITSSDHIQAEISREELKIMHQIDDDESETIPTSQAVTEADRTNMLNELGRVGDELSTRDKKLIQNFFLSKGGSEEEIIDFAKMDRKAVYHLWYRTSGILNNTDKDWSSSPETEKLLRRMNGAAREAILSFSRETIQIENISSNEARWLALPKEERDLINRNLDFIERSHGDFRELLREQEQRMRDPREITTRTDVAMHELLEENPDIEDKLVKENGRWKWKGTREELFDLARREVYQIQGGLTQENMGNLVFEDSAQKYLALMRIDVGNDLDLEQVKDAITKTLYIDMAVKTLWRAGGNMEAWQRAASVITQDSEYSFFNIMEIGEKLSFTDRDGNEIDIGRFNWKDLMTLAELKAPNGQYWMTYMAGQSTHLHRERKPEFATALADLIVRRQLQSGKLTEVQARQLMEKAATGGVEFADRQVKSIVDYMQLLEVATFRGGEFGLNNVTPEQAAQGKFNFTSLPGGEVVQKAGPWSILYYYKYGVTKYGGEWVGKMFLPNVNILSYRRGETLGHFIAKDTSVAAGLVNNEGEYQETGIGAMEFFFDKDGLSQGEKSRDATAFNNFWKDVIFDTRTGGVDNKTAINRTVEEIRRMGQEKLARMGNPNFANNINYKNFELLLGYKIPAGSNQDKFRWMVENFDYSFWRTDVMPSKAIGDWVGKYVPKKYEDARLKLQAFLNTPGTAALGDLRDIVSEYSDESVINAMGQAIINENRNYSVGLRLVDKDGHAEYLEQYENGKVVKRPNPFFDRRTAKRKLVGYQHASKKSKYIQEGAGDFYEVTQQWHAPTEGWHWGASFSWSRQQGKELFRDPMYFEEMEIDNQFHAGMLSREEWGQKKRDWQKMVWLGDKIPNTNIRWGYIPFLTPIFLFRGWWVDRMSLDMQDFWITFHKNNSESWEQFKKAAGFKW